MKIKRFPKLLLIPLVLVVFGLLTLIPAAFNKKSATTPGSTSKTAVPSDWQTYKSDKYGYSLQYPPDWKVTDNSSDTTRQVRVSEPNQLAYVKIDAYQDPSINSQAKVEEALAKFKQDRLDTEPGLTVTKYKSDFENHVGGYIAIGEQLINDQKFFFENRGLISDTGRILIFHSAYRADQQQQFISITPLIVSSFKLL